MRAGHIQRRVGIVFTDQAQDAERRFRVVVFGRHAHGLDHGADAVDVVVGKTDDPLGTGPHAGAAAAAARRVGFGRALFIVVQGAEGTFFRAALALGAALEEEVRKGHIAGARMHR